MNVQDALFQQIKASLHAHVSLVDEIADVLGMSYDSAYRRIRGEKQLSIEELKQLSQKFNISLDKLFHADSSQILFNNNDIDHLQLTFEDYLNFVLKDLSKFDSSETLELIYSAKDIPIFHHFRHPELAAFKVFFWLKSVLLYPDYAKRKFSFEETLEPILKVGNKIVQTYVRIPSIEIWNDDTIHGILRQIEYSFDIGIFENQEDAFVLLDLLEKEVEILKDQAEKGYKYLEGDEGSHKENNFLLYSSEVILGDNTIHVNMGESRITYLTFNVLSLLTTSDEQFCASTEKHLKNIISKSALISSVSERERSIFFNKMHQKVDRLRTRLKNSKNYLID